MQPIAGLHPRQESFRIGRIAHRGIKIEDPVKCFAGTDPLIDRAAHGLTVCAEVVGAFTWRQRGSGPSSPVAQEPPRSGPLKSASN